MKINDFKDKLTKKEIVDKDKGYPNDYPCFVFVCEDNYFVADQYASYLAGLKEQSITYIESEALTMNKDVFIDDASTVSPTLYVIKQDALTMSSFDSIQGIANLSLVHNTILMCTSIDKDVKDKLADMKYMTLVYIPKLKDWHIKEYIKTRCPGLKDTQIEWLYANNPLNIYAINNEVDKIEIFDKAIQDLVLDELSKANNFSVSNSYAIYNVANAIMKKDINALASSVEAYSKSGIDAFAFIGVMRKNLLNTILIQMNPKATAEGLGMSYGQFRAIQYNCNKYSNIQLAKMFDFITSLDSYVKEGLLDLDDNQLFCYVVLNLGAYMI
jgi:DNA polymerase III delta subunit